LASYYYLSRFSYFAFSMAAILAAISRLTLYTSADNSAFYDFIWPISALSY
jgi:hypothetical protein